VDEKCRGRKCLREINPEEFPGIYWGTPGDFDLNVGCCVHCEKEYGKFGKQPDPSLVWNPKIEIENITPVYIQPLPKLIPRKRALMIEERRTLLKIADIEREIAKLEKEVG
jgi:hypothetical protein